MSTPQNFILNPSTGPIPPSTNYFPSARTFHRQLPSYAPTPLIPLILPALPAPTHLFVKAENSRLGLPAFKILGASWGIHRALCVRHSLPPTATFSDVARHASGTVLVAATEGNHGRAVAAVARLLGTPARIHVPTGVNAQDARLIASEGAEVVYSQGCYDDALLEAQNEAGRLEGGLLVQDCALDGYEEIPAWIVEGYATMLAEVDEQLTENGLAAASLVVVPVGVGSLAHAVVAHYKAAGREGACTVVSVEPDAAPCLFESVRRGESVSVATRDTIMDGLNCGTVSRTAYPVLKAGVDACVKVSDGEAHAAVELLAKNGIESGPCGAASLAALRRLMEHKSMIPEDGTIVLLCTEGRRTYQQPTK